MPNKWISIKINGSSEERACHSYAPYFIVISNNKKASPSPPAPPPRKNPTQTTPSPKVSKKSMRKKPNNSNIWKDSGPGSGTPDQVASYERVMFASRDLLVQQAYSVQEGQKNQGGNP